MIYIPQLWNKPITMRKPIITIWAEEMTLEELPINKYGWGIGNKKENGRCGYKMLAPGRVIRGGLISFYTV